MKYVKQSPSSGIFFFVGLEWVARISEACVWRGMALRRALDMVLGGLGPGAQAGGWIWSLRPFRAASPGSAGVHGSAWWGEGL